MKTTPIFTCFIHIPGLIVHDSAVHSIPKKNMSSLKSLKAEYIHFTSEMTFIFGFNTNEFPTDKINS